MELVLAEYEPRNVVIIQVYSRRLRGEVGTSVIIASNKLSHYIDIFDYMELVFSRFDQYQLHLLSPELVL